MLALWKESYNKPRQSVKKQRHHFANKGLYCQSYGFSSSHVWMWELDHEEGWTPNNCTFWIVVKTLESPLDSKEIKLVNPKGNQPWIFTGRTDAKAEAPVLWPPDVKSHLMSRANSLEKTLMLGKSEGKRRRGRQRMRWSSSITDSMEMNLNTLWETVENRGPLPTEELDTQRVRHSDWTTTTKHYSNIKTRERPCETMKVWNNISHKCICRFFIEIWVIKYAWIWVIKSILYNDTCIPCSREIYFRYAILVQHWKIILCNLQHQ